MPDVDLTIDDAEFRRMVEQGDEIFIRAGVAALNKATAKTRTQVLRDASKATRVPQKHIRRRTYFRRANFRRLHTTILVYARPLSAGSMNPRQTKSGVTAAGRKFQGAFVMKSPNGATVVARRKGRKRLPVKAERIAIFTETKAAVDRHMGEAAREAFHEILPRELDWRLQKAAAGGAT